jgi:Raf kinase inhibitor-like YbhB/YbcL family protein
MHKDLPTPLILACAALLIASLCSPPLSCAQAAAPASKKSSQFQNQGGRAMTFAPRSTAFENGGEISRKFTCDGADISPALNWEDVPAGAQSLALIVDDPDAPAGTWTHWIIWNISATATALQEGVPKMEVLENGARQGKNDFRRIGYGGPCPPPGKPHRYFFKLLALDAMLDLKAGASRKELELAMKGHVLSEGEWMGKYKR